MKLLTIIAVGLLLGGAAPTRRPPTRAKHFVVIASCVVGMDITFRFAGLAKLPTEEADANVCLGMFSEDWQLANETRNPRAIGCGMGVSAAFVALGRDSEVIKKTPLALQSIKGCGETVLALATGE